MKRKFTFIGAGSLDFTQDLARDILSFEHFRDAEFHLVDIHEGRLAYAAKALEKLIRHGGYAATVHPTADRRQALIDSDGVLITILQGGVDVWRHDIEIPKKYGVDICVGDTRGPSGIFRFLRTAPVMLDIIRDVEELCPKAIVLNYTNPMALLCAYLQRQTKVQITGLCHSVQGTAGMLASWLGADTEDITYTCAGINHQAFYLDFKWKGKDAYPLLREAVCTRQEIAKEEPVRNEMFLHLDYYPTESSGHNSEYNAWFRKRPDLIETYCTHGTGWNPGEYAYVLKEYIEKEKTWEAQFKAMLDSPDVDLTRGEEYASNIFNALFGDHTPFGFNGNLLNTEGLIRNLPQGACVEVPMLASKEGIRPFSVGPLPDHLAVLVNTSARCEELAVTAALEGDPRKVFQSILFDPLTASVLSMAEIRDMTQEMLLKNKDFLGYFNSLTI
ncbi:alpha-glucosidase/alpha-galactosidase [Anoxybacterium hadale]|uniref:Alpha-glucosidase/alpha-galactosidase n=1 Tax=Anoxybacterium hadale TaxID=3408580 RepID=A0ACD1AG23_9FIRM|nr:alpha-glucosidase/alpha-galactosidase [Clostridiales bacterium]